MYNMQLNTTLQNEEWDIEIKAKETGVKFNLKEVWHYRDLLFLLVKRDFVAFYKQTILGPIWFFIQPVLTSIMFLVVFNKVAKIGTGDIPPVLFYLSGITCWNYFSESLTKTSDTFIANANIFGKVYFPRLIIPLSIVISNLMRFVIQLLLFIIVWLFYLIKGAGIAANIYILLLPVIVLLMAAIGLGSGIIFSSLTTKYRDLRFLLSFAIQLLMFATPIILPMSMMSGKYKWIIQYNPITPLMETFRFAFLGKGTFSWEGLLYASGWAVLLLLAGIAIFNRIEKQFMDTV